jgi:glucokinase
MGAVDPLLRRLSLVLDKVTCQGKCGDARVTSEALLVAGIDVGGTNIEVGSVDADHRAHQRVKAATPMSGPDAVLATVADLLAALDAAPIAVGMGIPGVVHDEGRVLTVPNLQGWTRPVDLGAALTERLRVPVALGNDVNVGLLGEWLAGAAKGSRTVLGVWMGTGIGGGLIVGGRPYSGSRGMGRSIT